MTAQVPAAPVVVIFVDGDRITVNGTSVRYTDRSRSAIEVGAQVAAEEVAQVVGRPVRAVVMDGRSRTSLIVHPDGRASDIEVFVNVPAREVGPVPPPAERAAPTVPTPPRQRSAERVPLVPRRTEPKAAPARPVPARPVPVAPKVTAPTAPPAATARAGAPTDYEVRRQAVLVVTAVFLVVGGVVGAAALVRDALRSEPQTTPVASTLTTATSLPPFRVATAPVIQLEPRQLDVEVVGGENVVELRVTSTRLPALAVVVITPEDGAPLRRDVLLEEPGTAIRFEGVADGTATWEVRVEDGETLQGEVDVAGFTPEPAQTVTFTPSAEPTPTPEPTSPPPLTGPTEPYDPDTESP